VSVKRYAFSYAHGSHESSTGSFVAFGDYHALSAELAELQAAFHDTCQRLCDEQAKSDALTAELTAIKRTREQEADYANTCYRNQQLEAALRKIIAALADDTSSYASVDNAILQAEASGLLTQMETPEAMRARIVTETADAIAKERGLPQTETKGDVTRGPCARCGTTTEQHGLACTETACDPGYDEDGNKLANGDAGYEGPAR
jgi:hypothetical protein